MRKAHVAILMIGLSLLAGLLTIAGCAPGDSNVCSTLANCSNLNLTEQENDLLSQYCPLLQIVSPDCYACLAENPCNPSSTCLQTCLGSLGQ